VLLLTNSAVNDKAHDIKVAEPKTFLWCIVHDLRGIVIRAVDLASDAVKGVPVVRSNHPRLHAHYGRREFIHHGARNAEQATTNGPGTCSRED
jgi:hypothetical protein